MDENFKKAAFLIWKIAVSVVLFYFTYLLFLVKTRDELYFGLGLLFFVTLPTLFVLFLKDRFLAKCVVISKELKFIRLWRVLKFVYTVIIILFILILVTGLYRAYQRDITEKAVESINSKKITLEDVMGKNLPPAPDQKLNDSTIAGIDANNNYIRDDVELAIFKKYPNSAKIRLAELQYAQALQLELTKVFNSKTLTTVLKEESRSIDCIGETGIKVSLKDSREKITAALSVTDNMKKEVEELVLNGILRQNKQLDNLQKYTAIYTSLPGNECDIELSLLPN